MFGSGSFEASVASLFVKSDGDVSCSQRRRTAGLQLFLIKRGRSLDFFIPKELDRFLAFKGFVIEMVMWKASDDSSHHV